MDKLKPIDIRDWEYPDSFDPDLVRQPAITFMKNGKYTNHIEGTFEYDKYWDEQEEYCLNGITSQGVYIPGRYYFYLNFFPMMVVEDITSNNVQSEILGFPSFLEYDYYWFKAKEEAKIRGLHLVCAKTRRAGFSYKEAADAVYNYNFIRNSKSFLFAARENYLIEDGIMSKVHSGVNFLNEYTDWYKNRQVKNTIMHIRASYINSDKIEKGYKSEVISVVCDDPNKVRGKSGVKITFEEFGSFKNGIQAWLISEPQVKQGSVVKGSMTALGTGGEEGENILGLETLFYNPEIYNCLPFKNIWDDESLGSQICGFFVPCYAINIGYIKHNGKYDRFLSKAYYDKERDKRKGDLSTYDKYIAELPYTPREAFMRIHNSIFPIEKIKQQELKALKQESIRYGILVKEDNNVLFKSIDPNNSEYSPLLTYPIKSGTIHRGCIIEYQTPYKDSTDHIPDDLYFITVDTYILDGEHDSVSIGSVRVWKQPKNVDNNPMTLCATYDARPLQQSEFYDNLFMLSKRWNAKIHFELQGGGQKIRDEAKKRKVEQYLAYTPLVLNNKEIKNVKNRSYGINLNEHLKRQYLRSLADWLLEPIGLDDEDGYIINLDLIYDVGLLRELQKYNSDGNFDRVSCALLLPIVLAEYEHEEILLNEESSDFFDRSYFIN